MKVKCVDNRDVEEFLTKGKVYQVEPLGDYFEVAKDDEGECDIYFKSRFEVIPSIDDVIKDKEKEK